MKNTQTVNKLLEFDHTISLFIKKVKHLQKHEFTNKPMQNKSEFFVYHSNQVTYSIGKQTFPVR